MSNKLYEENDIQNIANAIRNKNGTEDTYKVSQMSTAIDSIEVIEQATAEGESLSLTDTKAMPYSDYVVKGKSVQDGTPTPTNPVPIESVADDVNLFNYNFNSYESNGIIYTQNEDNTIILNGTATSNSYLLLGVYDLNDTYTLSGGNNLSSSVFMRGLDINNNYTAVFETNTNNKTKTVNSKFVFYLYISSGTTVNNLKIYPKLQKGSTATPYSPYNQGTVTIKQRGKLNQTATAQANFNSSHIDMDGSINTGDMVTLSGGSENVTVAIQTFTSDDTYIGASRDSGSTVKYTIPNNASKYAFNIRIPSGTVLSDYVLKPQLEQGSQATDFELYQTPHKYTIQISPLCSLPNGVKDTIEEDGIHRRVGRVVLDGSESSWSSYSQGFQYTYNISISDCKVGYQKSLCSHFKNSNQTWEPANGKVGQYSDHPTITNKYFNTDKSTLASWKEWLQQNPITLIYELAEEVIEPLTQNQATTMLDIIKTGSYEGTTNIYTDEDVKPTIGVGYYKKG